MSFLAIPFFSENKLSGCSTLSFTYSSMADSTLDNNESIAFSQGGYLYTKGGSNAGGINGTCDRYDPVANTWSTMATGYVGRGSSSFTIGTMSFVMGGYNTGYLNTMQLYDPTSNTWISKANLPSAVYRPGAFSDGTYGYIAGGDQGGSATTACRRYDPVANTWSSMTSMPAALPAYPQSFVIGNYAYVFGGNVAGSNKVYRYNISGNSWTTMTNFPLTSIGGGTGFVIAGKGYLVDGAANAAYNQDLYEYNEGSDTWSIKLSGLPKRNAGCGAVVDCKFYSAKGGETALHKTCIRIS